MMKFLKEYSIELALIMLVFISTVSAGILAERNGRIDMCYELGFYYTENGCITCEESGRQMVDGECVIVKQDSYSQIREFLNNKDKET